MKISGKKAKKPLQEKVQEQPHFTPVRLIVRRLELNNPVEPSCYIVGFQVISEINRCEKYLETNVPFAECENKSDNEICTMAYKHLKSRIEMAREEIAKHKHIIGAEFVPPLDE